MGVYTDPHDVTSPRVSISNLHPVCDRGEWESSVALLDWDHKQRVGVRWNGGTDPDTKNLSPGNPQSRGLPTWFVLPEEFSPAILQTLLDAGLIGGRTIDKANAEKWIREALDRIKFAPPVAGNKSQANDLERTIISIIKKLKAAGEL
jgi:hypothetical protein